VGKASAVAAVAALAFAGHAQAARFAVGVDARLSLPRIAAQLRSFGPVSFDLARMHALVVDAPSVRGVKRIRGVRWVEWLGTRRRRLAFIPNDPLVSKQWYLDQDHAFDFWPTFPVLPPVKVGIVDSGVDATHPELVGKVLVARSFVGGPATDQNGHGTFVAGEIAATLNNNEGIAGIAFSAQLLVAKVVRPDASISLEGEASAIRWLTDDGARVINLSLGGLRDPRHPSRDPYSPRAALPHVLGVSALARDGSVPLFSDRDQIYNDLAAPGQDIFSTLPRALTKEYPGCPDQGYSDCGSDEFRRGEGTSFAAPQVAAGAALLFAQDPALTSDQVTTLLERTADDANASNGCVHCPLLRDSLTGWGHLNIARALAVVTKGTPPPADRYETNDDAGGQARRIGGARGTIKATIDYWDDPVDVYALPLRAGQTLTATFAGPIDTHEDLLLWSPQTLSVNGPANAGFLLVRSGRPGTAQRIVFTVPPGQAGVYFLEVKISLPGSGPYTLTFAKR
jgi:hypothetical protein